MSEAFELERLQRAFAEAEPEPTAPAVDAERIFRAVAGELSPEELAAVVEEVASNPVASEAWELARILQGRADGEGCRPEEVRRRESTPLRSRAPARRRRWGWAMGLTSASAISAAILFSVLPMPGDGPVTSSQQWRGQGERIERVVGDPCSPSGCRLAWEPLDGARSYRVEATRESLEGVLEASETTQSFYDLDPAALARLEPGGVLLWRVVAIFEDGSETASETFSQPVS